MKYLKYMALSVALLLMCSCTSVQDMLEQETADLAPPAKDSISLLDLPDYLAMPLASYVTLGAYTGLTVQIDPITVTDEQVQATIDEIRTRNNMFEKITTRAAKWEDVLVLSYSTVNSDGSTGVGETDAEVALREDSSYPADFVQELVGAPCGIPVVVTVEDEKGTLTTYTVTVSYIKGAYEELTDAFVTAYTDGACTKADAFFAYCKEQMFNELYYDTVYDALWDACVANCKADVVPDEAVSYYIKSMEDYYRSMASENGVPYETVLEAFELDEIKMMQLSYGYAEKDMIFYAMIADAGLQVSEQGYTDTLHEYAEKYYDSFAPGVGKGSGQGGQVTVEDVARYLDAEQPNIIRELCYDAMLYDYLYANNTVMMGNVPMN